MTINANGQVLAFESLASDLVQFDTNNVSDVFVYAEVSLIDTLLADGFEQ